MIFIGQSVDDRDVGFTGQFLYFCVGISPDHDTVKVTAQNMGRVAHGLTAPAQLHFSLIEIEGIAAQFMDAHLKGDPGTGGGFCENQSDAFPGEGFEIGITAFFFHFGSEFKDLPHFILIDVLKCQKVFIHFYFSRANSARASSTMARARSMSHFLTFKGGTKRTTLSPAVSTSRFLFWISF